jgi:uncharacterized lipoprotein YddW (UPF0748 family)
VKKTSLILVILCLLFGSLLHAQFERETRAVWVATNYRLDWPPQTFDPEKQKLALKKIFEDVKSHNLNTVYFQVESNGTALFKSSYEPFSPYITGEVNGEASYDPLQFAIEQAHKRGLEIHAWINVFKCFNGAETSILNNPNHITKKKPEWIIEDMRDGQKSFWLDPGLPETREYISDVIAEMVVNYNLDGVQLDYIRYPGKYFEDDFSYNVHGKEMNRDDWRRKNITDAVDLIYKKIKSIKKFVKVGVAPIGIYKNMKDANGLEGYTEVYQDSREWLNRGIIDYVVPQIYWGINEKPRFDVLVKDWVQNSFGRNVVIGIGAYKENVKNDLDRMIQFTRAINASGVAFFRYMNIRDYDFQSFQYRTFPAAMDWLSDLATNNYPEPPNNLVYKRDDSRKNVITLSWDSVVSKKESDTSRYIALYNLPNSKLELRSDHLFDLFPADQNSITLAIEKPRRVNYYFALKSVDKLWNESVESSNTVEIKFPELDQLVNPKDQLDKPVLVKDSDGATRILLYSKIAEQIEVTGFKGIIGEKILTETLSPGKNILSINGTLSKYQSLLISYKSSKKEAKLKL